MVTTKKVIKCKRCGKKMGVVRIKQDFKIRLILTGLALVFISEIIAELAVRLLL